MSHLFARTATALVTIVSAAALVVGCNQDGEGDRCVLPNSNGGPYSHDSCGSGLSCQQPKDCPESYCCPPNGVSSNPYCQPGCNGGQASICAAGGDADCSDDGGTTDAAAEAASDAASAPSDASGGGDSG